MISNQSTIIATGWGLSRNYVWQSQVILKYNLTPVCFGVHSHNWWCCMTLLRITLPAVTKATRSPSLMCPQSGNVAGTRWCNVRVNRFLAKVSVYYNNDQAVFFLLGDTGRELTGKPDSELVDSYFWARDWAIFRLFSEDGSDLVEENTLSLQWKQRRYGLSLKVETWKPHTQMVSFHWVLYKVPNEFSSANWIQGG